MLHGLSSRQWWWVTLFVTMRLALTMGLSPSNLKYSAKWKREHEKNVNNARAAVKRGGKLDVLWLVSLGPFCSVVAVDCRMVAL
jgi:hypothetical protein